MLFRDSFENLVDSKIRRWIDDHVVQAIEVIGPRRFKNSIQLVTATDRFFPRKIASRKSAVREVHQMMFAASNLATLLVKWRYLPLDQFPENIGGTIRPLDPSLEIHREARDIYQLQYNHTIYDEPETLISGLARALAIVLFERAQKNGRRAEDADKYFLELIAVFHGYGIFMANGAFVFDSISSYDENTLKTGTRSFFSEWELTYALARFCALKECAESEVTRHLDRHLRRFLKTTIRDPKKSD